MFNNVPNSWEVKKDMAPSSAGRLVMPSLLVFTLTSCALVGVGCARNPVSGRPEVVLVSAAQERKIGREEAEKVEARMGLVADARLSIYVREIGRRLAQHSPRQDVEYQFHVVDAPEPNAFALPGGYVYVSRGLLALVNAEDELAGAIAHEIGHVAARHHVRQATLATPFAIVLGLPAAIVGTISETLGNVVAAPGKFTGELVLARHSRKQEREADRIGMEMAASAGWDPGALAAILHTLEREDELNRGGPRRPDFFDSHPSMPERVKSAAARAESMERAPAKPIGADRKALLDRLEGLLVGPNPAGGVFVEGDFLHPELDFALSFPETWETDNQPEFVIGMPPEGKGKTASILGLVGEGEDPVEGARADELDERLLGELEELEINGLRAARVVTERRGSGFDLTWIAHGGHVYRIASVSPSSEFTRHRDGFQDLAQSFRPLRGADRARIRESRLRARPGREGESLVAFLQRTGGTWSPAEVVIANGLEHDVRLGRGQLLKVPIPERYTPQNP
jgi:predicted Zn-dependent protease